MKTNLKFKHLKHTKMKYLLPVFVIALIWTGCSFEDNPQDLDALKATLKTKKADLKKLNKEIDSLIIKIEQIEPPKEVNRTLVTTQKVAKSDFKSYTSIQATVKSDDIVMASSEIGGRLLNVAVKEGQNVNKGQLIALTDLESVAKQIAELETSLDLAKTVYERQKRLWDQNVGSEMQYLQAKNNKERLEKSLETIRYQLTKAKVYAPISGVVDHVFLKSGELAGPGVPIAQILNTQKVKVVADVPESYLNKIKKGEIVTVQFPAINQESKSKVTLIGRTINPSNRTFTVEIDLPNKGGFLKPNLLSIMLINDNSQEDVIVIPIELVQQEVSGRSYVFVKDENSEGAYAKKVFVETAESYDGNIIITSGLEGGEELIVTGARGLANNELIKIVNQTKEETNG
jgi:RND family efflux transporter MFP subunit